MLVKSASNGRFLRSRNTRINQFRPFESTDNRKNRSAAPFLAFPAAPKRSNGPQQTYSSPIRSGFDHGTVFERPKRPFETFLTIFRPSQSKTNANADSSEPSSLNTSSLGSSPVYAPSSESSIPLMTYLSNFHSFDAPSQLSPLLVLHLNKVVHNAISWCYNLPRTVSGRGGIPHWR